mgnify:CR=1 FL=1|tara:strand:+ start:504 stop:689 length:186 start_codon:yes stop_codon:yes gene_type:complete
MDRLDGKSAERTLIENFIEGEMRKIIKSVKKLGLTNEVDLSYLMSQSLTITLLEDRIGWGK